jgi:hypothetical protein
MKFSLSSFHNFFPFCHLGEFSSQEFSFIIDFPDSFSYFIFGKNVTGILWCFELRKKEEKKVSGWWWGNFSFSALSEVCGGKSEEIFKWKWENLLAIIPSRWKRSRKCKGIFRQLRGRERNRRGIVGCECLDVVRRVLKLGWRRFFERSLLRCLWKIRVDEWACWKNYGDRMIMSCSRNY